MWISPHCNVNFLFPSVSSIEMGIWFILESGCQNIPREKSLTNTQYWHILSTKMHPMKKQHRRMWQQLLKISEQERTKKYNWLKLCAWDSANHFICVNIIQVVEYFERKENDFGNYSLRFFFSKPWSWNKKFKIPVLRSHMFQFYFWTTSPSNNQGPSYKIRAWRGRREEYCFIFTIVFHR